MHSCEQTVRSRLGEFGRTKMATQTVEQLKKIANQSADPLKRTASEMSIEENLEPPSVRKELCKMLDNCSENELDRYLL